MERRRRGIRTIIVVVAHNELLELAVLAQLTPDVLVEGVKVVLQLGRVHAVLGIVGRVLVKVGHEDGLAVGGLDVFSRAAVAMSAGTNFLMREGAMARKLAMLNRRHECEAVVHWLWTGEGSSDLQSRRSS